MSVSQDVLRINLGITNIFLTKYHHGYLMIDTGYSDDYLKFLKALRDLEIDINDIRYLFLTHHHDDHTGFAKKNERKLRCSPDCT